MQMSEPTRRLDAEPARSPAAAMHTTIIATDTPVEVKVEVGGGGSGGSGYWFKVFSAMIEGGAWARMGPSAAKAYLCLAYHANGNPALACWPSADTLQRESGLSRSSLYEGLAELVSAGLVVRRMPGGGATTTTYQIAEPRGSTARARRAPEAAIPSPTPPTSPALQSRALHARAIRQSHGLASPAGRTPPPDPSGIPDGYPSGQPDRPVRLAGPHQESGIEISSSSSGTSRGNRPDQDPAAATLGVDGDGGGDVGGEVESLLRLEGFSERDIASLAAHGMARVRKAIANADSLQKRNRLRGERRAYLASAIRDDYSLLEAAERDLWPRAADLLRRKLAEVADEHEAAALAEAFHDPLGALKARAVTVADVEAMTPHELLQRLLNRARTRR